MLKKSKNFETWYQAWCLMVNSGACRAQGGVSAQNGSWLPAKAGQPSRRWFSSYQISQYKEIYLLF